MDWLGGPGNLTGLKGIGLGIAGIVLGLGSWIWAWLANRKSEKHINEVGNKVDEVGDDLRSRIVSLEKDVFYTQRQIREGMSEMKNTQKRESDRASSAVKLHELNISKSTLNFNIGLGMDKVFEKMSKEFSAVGVEQKSENIESEIETENKRVGSSDNDEPN